MARATGQENVAIEKVACYTCKFQEKGAWHAIEGRGVGERGIWERTRLFQEVKGVRAEDVALGRALA
jgi:hypothetical protein